MKELTLAEIDFVSGGDGAVPATAANAVGAAIIAGAIAGIPLGPGGMLGSAALAGITTAIGTTVQPGGGNQASIGGGWAGGAPSFCEMKGMKGGEYGC